MTLPEQKRFHTRKSGPNVIRAPGPGRPRSAASPTAPCSPSAHWS